MSQRAFDPTNPKPRNLCLTVQDSAELSRALSELADQEGVFVAPSLEALRQKVYTWTEDTIDLVDSPFQKLCQSDLPHKTLVIPGGLLKKARGGPSDYYPLLDSTRIINDISVPAALNIVVLISPEDLKYFREDFKSRFQLHGTIDPETLPAIAGEGSSMGVEESKTIPLEAGEVIKTPPVIGEADIPDSVLRIDAHNFHQLFRHKDITPHGLAWCPGWLEEDPKPSIAIVGNLTPEQWRQLKAAGDSVQFFDPTSAVGSSEPRLILHTLPREAIPKAIPEGAVSLAFPELGNPFVRRSQGPDGLVAEFTELKTRLETPGQTLVLYGKLSPTLHSELMNLNTGKLRLAGEPITVGEGTKVILLEPDKSSPSTLLPASAEAKHNPFCTVQEGPVNISELKPWRERLQEWLDGTEPCLQLSSFDLMNPESRSVCRDLVNSAFSGYVMVEGKIINLRETAQTVHVQGTGVPSAVRKMAQAFGGYEAISTTPRFIPLFLTEESLTAGGVWDFPKESGIISTPSRWELVHTLEQWLDKNDSNCPLFLVEGPSGIGKTAVMKAYLMSRYPEKMEVLLPSEDLIQKIEAANRAGKIILIDEMNTLRADQLEAISVLMQSNPRCRLVATQNPVSFSGRARLDPALLEHAAVHHLTEYSTDELRTICKTKGVPSEVVDTLIESFKASVKTHRRTFRDFLAGVEKVARNIRHADSEPL